MTGIFKKRILSLLPALAVLASGITVFQNVSAAALEDESSAADTTAVTETVTEAVSTAPQNLRLENGFIVWDEVEGAYGYTLQTNSNGKNVSEKYYENRAELNRFCYDKKLEFGGYNFKVCFFNESNVSGDWSEPIAVNYQPTLETPKNVRLNDDGESILWDDVSGATRFNARVFNVDKQVNAGTINRGFIPHGLRYFMNYSGNFSIEYQVMDDDYNISDWSEPFIFSYTAPGEILPPKNVRFDESGNSILWDAVDGARFYNVCMYNIYNDGSSHGIGNHFAPDNVYHNWKSHTCPFSNGKYKIYISVTGNDCSADSEPLTVTFIPDRDESIKLPESIQVDGDYLRWSDVDGADGYWLRIYRNGKLVEGQERHYVSADKNNGVELFKELPEGVYSAELFVVDKNYNFNSKTYTFALNTDHNSAVWTPKVLYKFETLLWDFDEIRNKTSHFWIKIDQNGETICLEKLWDAEYNGLKDLPNGEYEVQVCAYYYLSGLGPWSEPLTIIKHSGSLFDKDSETAAEVEMPPEAAEIPNEDKITSITFNKAFNMSNKNGELNLTKKLEVKASAIYDEAGLKRASEALGTTISGNTHYNLLDLTLLYDGKDFSNGYEGLVQVIIPIPEGHRDKTYTCYRLVEKNGKMTKEIIPGEQTEDSYIIYLEHFSEYALVGTAAEDSHTLEKHEAVSATCTTEGSGVFWECSGCGKLFSDENGTVELNEIPVTAKTAHTWNSGKITKQPTTTTEGVRTYTCAICAQTRSESIAKLSSSSSGSRPSGSSSRPRPSAPTASADNDNSDSNSSDTVSGSNDTSSGDENSSTGDNSSGSSSSETASSGSDASGSDKNSSTGESNTNSNSGVSTSDESTHDPSEGSQSDGSGNPATGIAIPLVPLAAAPAVIIAAVKRRRK